MSDAAAVAAWGAAFAALCAFAGIAIQVWLVREQMKLATKLSNETDNIRERSVAPQQAAKTVAESALTVQREATEAAKASAAAAEQSVAAAQASAAALAELTQAIELMRATERRDAARHEMELAAWTATKAAKIDVVLEDGPRSGAVLQVEIVNKGPHAATSVRAAIVEAFDEHGDPHDGRFPVITMVNRVVRDEWPVAYIERLDEGERLPLRVTTLGARRVRLEVRWQDGRGPQEETFVPREQAR